MGVDLGDWAWGMENGAWSMEHLTKVVAKAGWMPPNHAFESITPHKLDGAFFVIRVHDPGHQGMANHIGRREGGERDALNVFEHLLCIDQAALLAFG